MDWRCSPQATVPPRANGPGGIWAGSLARPASSPISSGRSIPARRAAASQSADSDRGARRPKESGCASPERSHLPRFNIQSPSGGVGATIGHPVQSSAPPAITERIGGGVPLRQLRWGGTGQILPIQRETGHPAASLRMDTRSSMGFKAQHASGSAWPPSESPCASMLADRGLVGASARFDRTMAADAPDSDALDAGVDRADAPHPGREPHLPLQ